MTYPKHIKVLSLDLATQTGWAVLANGVVTSGTKGFQRYLGSKSKPADHQGAGKLAFHYWIHEILRDDKPECICYEAVYRWMSSAASITYGSYHGLMMAQAANYDIPVFGYSPTHIKKFWTGKGNSKKDAMIAEAKTRHPEMEIVDDNQADALAILALHINQTMEPALVHGNPDGTGTIIIEDTT